MAELPPPLTPADCDLRAYAWFPFHYRRLRQSAWWKRASDTACRISVDLWAEAYEQVPAGSLPNDDHTLADWAGFGRRDLAGWLAVRDEVLSAWTLCSDGRWYHPTLCEVANEAWLKHQEHAQNREKERLRKEAYRARATALNAAQPDIAERPAGQEELSHGTDIEVPPEIALTRTGTRTGTNIILPVGTQSVALVDPNKEAWQRVCELLKASGSKDAAARSFFGKLLSEHALEARDLLPSVVKAEGLGTPDPQGYLAMAAKAVASRRGAQAPDPSPEDRVKAWGPEEWRAAVAHFRETGRWHDHFGPAPDKPGCRASPEILTECGFTGAEVISIREALR
jgi:hypothetical protein